MPRRPRIEIAGYYHIKNKGDSLLLYTNYILFKHYSVKQVTIMKMPNTINSLDEGVFSQFKKLTKVRQGITKSLKSKLIEDCLVSYNKKL